jgi:Zn-dependent peptidase ImmA (M78 family)
MISEDLGHLRGSGNGTWSAVTIFCSGRPIVILNEAHALRRRESDLHHEAAHLLCKHVPSVIQSLGDWAIRTYDAETEAEATWLAGCLHLPRPALYYALCNGLTEEEIAVHFVASVAMVRYRRAVTAIDRQLSRSA